MKRLVVCCDGTWNWPDQKGGPTNVVKMVRAILPSDSRGVPQVVSYDVGVGTGNILDRVAGGMFGVGLADNVKQAYGFLVDNYEPDDQLFFFGFSRGAHTVRSLGGMVGLVGLLEKRHMDKFPEAWEYYRTPPPKRTKEQEGRFASIRRRARIELIGVWDTVGTMGVPFGPLRWIGRRRYRFHNTNLGDNVAHAYQALAVDEQRRFFAPTVWRREPGIENRLKGYRIDHQVIEQTWFAGVHSNVGGGYPDTGLSDLAFVWMAKRAARHGLALDQEHVRWKQENTRYLLVDSRTLKWRLTPAKLRKLCVTDVSERVHCSAVSRLDGNPPPFEPRPYESSDLTELRRKTQEKFKDLIDWD